jgi:chaperone required for assembly of F1-ATPase
MRRTGVEATERGFTVTLDKGPAKTPAGRPLRVEHAALAAALAEEWSRQGATLKPETMTLTRLANTALDRLDDRRDAIIDELVAYAGSDLLCYRVRQPADLVRRQGEIWQPLLDWSAAAMGAPLTVTDSLLPVAQPAASLAALRGVVEAYDRWRLAGLMSVVPPLGSLILGLALVEGRLSIAAAFAASQLDEEFQAERWGRDGELTARQASLLDEVETTVRFLSLCR